MTESLLAFYRRHRISPVRQDIHDLRAHFGRRAALYRHLGILPGFLRGRTALEVGPGSGFNSLYTASLEPSRYVLLEANPRGVDDIRQLFANYPSLAERIEVIAASADDYESAERFAFVFCEGMLALAGVPDPRMLLRTVARNTEPGGVLVITCIDAVSDFSEVLRRFIAQWLIDPARELGEQVAQLLPVFSPHLSTLEGMNRRHDDWIVDNLLNPASIGPLLSIPDAIAAVADEFDVFGSSPRFLTDWRWYKAIGGEGDRFNELALEAYWANVHNLLDYRVWSVPRDPIDNHHLYDACATVRGAVQEYERERDRGIIAVVLGGLDTIVAGVRSLSRVTSDAVAEVRAALAEPVLDTAAVAAGRGFGPWFGRGQQYLSFSRRTDPTEAHAHERRDD
jgi:SAM-dependent methyltransferase